MSINPPFIPFYLIHLILAQPVIVRFAVINKICGLFAYLNKQFVSNLIWPFFWANFEKWRSQIG